MYNNQKMTMYIL